MDIFRYPLGQLQANCYLVVQDKDCLIIDPADSAEFILEQVQRKSLNLKAMIATHGHFDHVMAAGEIQLSFSNLPLLLQQKDEFLVKRLAETAKYFLGFDPQVVPIKQIKYLTEGFCTIDPFTINIMSTPGHTPGSCCLYFPDEAVIFTGDTLFNSGVGRYDFKYSDKKLLKKSIQQILELPEFTTIYPGHGEDSLVQMEVTKRTIDLIP